MNRTKYFTLTTSEIATATKFKISVLGLLSTSMSCLCLGK